eukprot:CAMPEP_0179319154 /NCGR_PEP_ID=MMETSP0797-20121207/57320_1 /TAXON_ID=47934 /ORGANISM="Dinophysis acuminata, Strain DAEP01" /LENGTH=36 /DNA_ID= /DNA_START= /DNA_END= /DNA_ORIENTATION=
MPVEDLTAGARNAIKGTGSSSVQEVEQIPARGSALA